MDVLKKPAMKRPASQTETLREKRQRGPPGVNPRVSQALVVLKKPAMEWPGRQMEARFGEIGHRGHYDVMGVHRNATANEIRSAFRALALEKHPDKGGAVDDWNRFWLAWEVLKDEALRASYNAELSRSGCLDGVIVGRVCKKEEWPLLHHSQLELGQARNFLEQYLLGICNDETMLATLKHWSVDRCSALLELSRGSANTCQMDTMPESPCNRNASKVHGIYRRANGAYKIYIGWRQFDVEALETKSLAMALDYHLALTSLKQKLVSRQEMGEQYIFAEEMLTLLTAHPQLGFRFTLRRQIGNRVYRLPRFVDVQLAELHAQKLAKARTIKAAKNIIHSAKANDTKNRSVRNERLCRLRDALADELVRKAKAAEVRVNMLQYELVCKGRKMKEDRALLNHTLQQREKQFALTLRSQAMQAARPLKLLNGPLTHELWPVKESNCCCRIMEFLSFKELGVLQRASYATKCSRDLGMVWIFNNFKYIPGDARIGFVPPRTRGGRDAWLGGSRGTTAQRIFLNRFLPRQKALLGKHELMRWDFSSVKGNVLEADAVQECFGALHGLKQIILPSEGWTSPMQKKQVLKALHPDVAIVFTIHSGRIFRRQTRAKERAKMCPNGHDLQNYVNDTGDANTCDCCQRVIQPPEPFFRCDDCDFDHCQVCCYEV